MLVLDTHERSGGGVDRLPVLHVLSAEVLLQGGEVLQVVLVDVGEGDAGGGLRVNEGTEGGLRLDDAVRNILGAAESRQEGHHLDAISVPSRPSSSSRRG